MVQKLNRMPRLLDMQQYEKLKPKVPMPRYSDMQQIETTSWETGGCTGKAPQMSS